jgi:hypothetical protein
MRANKVSAYAQAVVQVSGKCHHAGSGLILLFAAKVLAFGATAYCRADKSAKEWRQITRNHHDRGPKYPNNLVTLDARWRDQ